MTEYKKSQLGLPHIFDEPMTRMYYEAAKLSDEYNRTSLFLVLFIQVVLLVYTNMKPVMI